MVHFLTPYIKFFAHSHTEQLQKKDTNESRLPDDTMQNTPKEIHNKNTSQKTFAGSSILSTIQLVYPTKFNKNNVFAFSWEECNTQEKLKTILIKKIGGKQDRKTSCPPGKKACEHQAFFHENEHTWEHLQRSRADKKLKILTKISSLNFSMTISKNKN